MIVPMKKVAIIAQSKDANSLIKTLASLGIVHVEHQTPPAGDSINTLRDGLALLEKAINILRKINGQKKNKVLAKETLRNWKTTATHVVDLENRLDRLEEYQRITRAHIAEWQPWGEFDPGIIKHLSEKKIYVRLYRIPVRRLKDFPPSVIVKTISASGGHVNCAVFSREEIEIPFKELDLPKSGIKIMRDKLAEDEHAINAIKKELVGNIVYVDNLVSARKSLENKLEFEKALEGMGKSGKIAYLTGYAPYDTVGGILSVSKKEKWAVRISEPSPEENVPTLIKNPRWVSIIAPLFKVIEIVPGYRELDISMWFLLFFSVFFGMLIGDAGYGAIFFGLTFLAQRKWRAKIEKSVFILFYLLSSSAIIWGVLSGTFFGQAWLSAHVKPLLAALRDDKALQGICFFIGAIHLSVAHLWRAVTKLPSAKSLSDVGWVSVLWGGFFLARTLILGHGFPAFGKWFFIAGALLVVFFTDINKNIIKAVGSGLGALLLNLVNSFTDIVSYVRLFAVGLAGVAIADAFNKMAADIGYNSILKGFLTAVILLVGHGLNILLGPLAVLVHGVRLNVLEFSSHLDIKWSGFSYKPLKEEGE